LTLTKFFKNFVFFEQEINKYKGFQQLLKNYRAKMTWNLPKFVASLHYGIFKDRKEKIR